MFRNGRQDIPKAVQEYLRTIEIDMSLSRQKKHASSADMGQKTLAYYGKPVEAVDGSNILQPYQTEPHVERDGRSVLFYCCITANGPGYGTTVMGGSLDSIVYVDILQTSFLDTLEYYDMNRNVIRFQQDNATRHTSGTTQD
ncbi:hypothetical protein INT46_001537 [Mucor plumbeus]|uniref:Transposase n=1 Tax=Mucor plumbeus TaxID=97098 RepID=A0A8H7R5N8_9FUNG|nr:hypothetical protein INT46_001537 [Mucor plumbeus]